MKTRQKRILTIVGVAIIVYAIGAYIGFPFAELGITSGNIGKANKQQELVNSPADVKLAERFEKDTTYRNDMIKGLGMLLVQTKATVSTLEELKNNSANVPELKEYVQPVNEAIEVGNRLSEKLAVSLNGLSNISEGNTSGDDLSLKMSQSLNMFQILNTKLSKLDAFASKANELAKQKKLNNNLLKLFSEYSVESSDIALACGESSSAASRLGCGTNLGMEANEKTLITQKRYLKCCEAYTLGKSSALGDLIKDVISGSSKLGEGATRATLGQGAKIASKRDGNDTGMRSMVKLGAVEKMSFIK